MEEMNKVEEMIEVATEVVAGNEGTEIVQTFDLPTEVVTEKSGSALKIVGGVTAAALAVGGLIYGGVKLVKHFRRKKKMDRDFEDDYYEEEDVDVEPYPEDYEDGIPDQEPVREK